MRKTVVKSICDDCYKEINEFTLSGTSAGDLCLACVTRRVLYSISVLPIGAKCKFCEGHGKIKDFYGPHNDYNWEDCKHCGGTGQTPFKREQS